MMAFAWPHAVLLPGTSGPVRVVGGFITTPSGRRIPGPPRVDDRSARTLTNGNRAYHQWLLAQARAEAQARGDTWNGERFAAIKPMKLRNGALYPQADNDALWCYLFGTAADDCFAHENALGATDDNA